MRISTLFACFSLLLAPAASAVAQGSPAPLPTKVEYTRIAREVDSNLEKQVIAKWFPAAVDVAHGGFHQNYAENWDKLPSEDRAIVYQSRLTWIAAEAARSRLLPSKQLITYCRHGERFLAEKMWDRQSGGFFWAIGDDGQPDRRGEKHAYGISFGIYACANCYAVTHDRAALDLALRAYRWLDDHAHDGKNGGYFEALTRDGTPIMAPQSDGAASDFIGTKYGLKSMNTHIHLLEAFSELYKVHPAKELKARLRELFEIVRNRVYTAPGYLQLYFKPDWQAVPDHDSYGHDIETAYLLADAAEVLGMKDDAKTWEVARAIVDHALKYGWDEAHGGFYDAGEPSGAVTATDKIWWTQAEGLNALLLMHSHFGSETSIYWNAFNKEWDFIQHFQVDARSGGWYAAVAVDGAPLAGRVKSDRWTEAYHQGRALLNVSRALKQLAGR